MNFRLQAPFKPTGDQPQAINKLVEGLKRGNKDQVLLGVTGSGKTFTIANVIQKVSMPALVISHNKTLAAQLYQEFRDFFPNNAVGFFVSYYDYYQPEAYIPQTDKYIEKETDINEEIDKLRLESTSYLMSRGDVIIVASVSCIYNIGSPAEYRDKVEEIKVGDIYNREEIIERLVSLQYKRSNYELTRSTFRIKGDVVDIFPSYKDQGIRIYSVDNKIKTIHTLDALNGEVITQLKRVSIYPAKHNIAKRDSLKNIFQQIKSDLNKRVDELIQQGRKLEAHRLKQKVNYDLEMIEELGYVNGIENYSRYFDGRKPGEPPYTLLDYFKYSYAKQWMLIIDESHMTIPQIRGMFAGDRSRKQTLIDFGFRLPAALDNRPLTILEFLRLKPSTIYMSATPQRWEIEKAQRFVSDNISSLSKKKGVVEQLIRPTGIIDPKIIIKPSKGQISNLVKEIIVRKKRGERVLVTTLTKRTAQDLTSYLNEKKYLKNLKLKDVDDKDLPTVHYLHSDVKTLVRSNILDDLRSGKYDVIIGINLLREGLDLPEVSLVAILDADREGFLRSETSLIQTMGRAARHIQGQIIMYSDSITKSMKRAIDEIERRREIQIAYNIQHNIVPKSVEKPIRKKVVEEKEERDDVLSHLDSKKRDVYRKLLDIDFGQLVPSDRSKLVNKLKREMRKAAQDLNFELAAEIRDKIIKIDRYRYKRE